MKEQQRPSSRDGTFVGRARELDWLRSALGQIHTGREQLFMIAGEGGIGKTRLADEVAADAARQDVRVLRGRCWEGGGAPPYWPWVQVIRACARDRASESLSAALAGGASDILQIVPELRERMGDVPPPPPRDGDEARFRLFDSVALFLRNVCATQPVMLIFDDMHAADMSSLLLLRFVAAGLRDAPLLILALYQDDEMRQTTGLAEMFGALAREGHRLVLQPFTEPEVAALIAPHFAVDPTAVSPEIVAFVHRASDGNPFFVEELVRWLVADSAAADCARHGGAPSIPAHVREAVDWRLRRVPEPPAAVSAHSAAVPAHAPESVEAASTSRRWAYELGRLLGQQHDLEHVLSLATTQCRGALSAEGIAVLLLDRARDELYFPYVAEADPVIADRLRKIRFPADRGIVGAALRHGIAVRSDDVKSDPRFFPGVDEITGRQTRAVLCAPLIGQHGALGVVEAVNPRRSSGFSDDDLALLDAVARTMAEAIDQLQHGAASASGNNVFRKEGDYWLVAYDGSTCVRLKDAKGLAFLACLLCQPGRELHAVDVVRACTKGDTTETVTLRDVRADLRRSASLGDAGPQLDAPARAAYRRRLDELRAELEDAQSCNDPGRAGRAQHEMEALTKELARAVGLGGRERRDGSASERARVNVTRAIALALKRIEEQLPNLVQHFARTVKTGTFCVYTPDPRVPIEWET